MVSHVLNADVRKPDALDWARWAPVEDCLDRLHNSVRSGDRPLVVGSAKDLVEAVSRVVLAVRGQPAASDENYDKVLSTHIG